MLFRSATSALDGSSERKVQNSFNKLQEEQGMMMIVVAHRLSTIKNAHKIIVLHDGVLKEEGTDKELRDKNTIYANLCRLQDFEVEELEDIETEILRLPRKKSTSRKLSLHEDPSAKSQEVTKLTKEQEEKKMLYMKEKGKAYRSQLWQENWKHKKSLIAAIVLSLMSGFFMPTIGLLFGYVTMDLQKEEDMRKSINLDFMGFCICGVSIFGISIGMNGFFGYVASHVTRSMREKLYKIIFTMDIGWFDLPENIASNLNTLLSEGTQNINGVVRLIAGTIIQCLSAIIIALAIGFSYSWKMSLIVLGCIPIVGASIIIHAKFQMGFAKTSDELYKDSTKILSEAVKNFRTVASFTSQKRILKLYTDALIKPLANSHSSAIISGVLFGIGQLVPFLIFAGLFYFAAWFMVNHNDDPKKLFTAMYALLFSVMVLAQVQQYAPDLGKAYSSLFSIYGIMEQSPKIKSPENPTNSKIRGKIEFKNVSFKYPTREDYVLQDFNMTIEAGKKAAIVGISGSGKSTLVQLLERFYDVDSGEILIDGVNIKDYSIADLRHEIGYVPQEPVLFDTTIEENVKYGREATRERVEAVCQLADATDFIMKDEDLPKEYLMMTGALGTQRNLNEDIDIGKGYVKVADKDRKHSPCL